MGNNKYKVLIVEDDQSILGFVQTILETNGYQVLTAERCRQGLLNEGVGVLLVEHGRAGALGECGFREAGLALLRAGRVDADGLL